MKAPRLVVFAIAVVATILLVVAFMSKNSQANKPHNVVMAAPQIPMVKVLVAAHDLNPGQLVGESDLTWAEWPQSAVTPAYQIEPDTSNIEEAKTTQAKIGQISTTIDHAMNKSSTPVNYVGGRVRELILAHEPILGTKIVRSGQGGFMAAILPTGVRAMSVSITVESTAGGFILPGDYVDVMSSHNNQVASGPSGPPPASILLKNIKVLAIDQATTLPKKDQASVIGATATLAVTPQQGEILAQAKGAGQGALSLMLRSYADIQGEVHDHSDYSSHSVKIIRSGEVSDVAVQR